MKVLVAEDHRVWQQLLREKLLQWHYEPVVVGDGDEALEMLRKHDDIRIALLDWLMPGTDGLTVCKTIKSDPNRGFTYVLMLTGRDSNADTVKGLDAGADEYLTKPVDMNVLKSRLHAAERIIKAIPPAGWTRPQIDGYEIQQVLGKGAFATVWKARHVETERDVAIKILRIDLATEQVFRRFEREIKIMRTLDHPNIARVYDHRIDRDLGYYAMELLDGGDVLRHCRDHKSGGTGRIALMAGVCRGLADAHDHGIIHRDLKFANVMIGHQTDADIPKIVDFGMSKSLFTTPSEDLTQTIEGSILGTPLFMSPEQARGETSSIDHRTDIYAVGIMLYLLLLKRHPHQVNPADRAETIEAIGHGKIVSPIEIKPDFNPRVALILMRMLAARPDDRYQSCSELADALDSFLASR